jgi:hypothetical protein
MATRRVRTALWHYHQHLQRQASAQECVAGYLVEVADALRAGGRPKAARCLVSVAIRFRVKAICLSAQAEALNWQQKLPISIQPFA